MGTMIRIQDSQEPNPNSSHQSDAMADQASASPSSCEARSSSSSEVEAIGDLSLDPSESPPTETLADQSSDGAVEGELPCSAPPPSQGLGGNNLCCARDHEEEASPTSPSHCVGNGLSNYDSNWSSSGPLTWSWSNESGHSTDSSFSIQEAKASMVGAGLLNLGNTCFINAVLQCFTHTVPLVKGLLLSRHAMPCESRLGDFCVLCALYDHIKLSIDSSGGIISPLKFVDNLNHFSSSFLRYEQEDAHEFLQCFLDKLERCFLDSKMKEICANSPDENLVQKVFGGRLISKLKCCNCGNCSDTFEPLIDLSLEIENVDSLPSALESFTIEEKIEDSDMKFTCQNCKEEVGVVKQLMVDQAPSVAVFHLKRFKTDGSFVEKIDKHVDFPLELNLQSYTTKASGDNVELMYDLYAIIVHVGFSSMSGHYFSFIRSSPDTWHRLDDSKVTRVQEEFVLSQDAYVLFYAKRGTPWFSSLMDAEKQFLDLDILSTSPQSVLDTIEKVCPLTDKNDASVAPDAGDCFQNLSCVNVNICNTTSLGENNCDQGVELEEVKDSGDDVFHPLTPPRPQSPDMSFETPGPSYQIPRNHLKSEERTTSRKRLLNKVPDDSETKEAIRYLTKSMPSSRGSKLLDAMCRPQSEGALRKKKRLVSPCKRAGPANARHKSNHGSVVHPVAALLR